MDLYELKATIDSIQTDSFKNDAERFEVMEAAKRLVARLETPFERTFSLTLTNPVLIAGLQLCGDLGIWRNWTKQCKTSGNTAQHIDSVVAMSEVPVEANLLRECSFPRVLLQDSILTCDRKISQTSCCIKHPRTNQCGQVEADAFHNGAG